MINIIQRLLSSPRSVKIAIIALNDFLILFLSSYIIIVLFNDIQITFNQKFLIYLLFGIIYLPLFLIFNLYKNLIRFSLFQFQNLIFKIFTLHFIIILILIVIIYNLDEISISNLLNLKSIFVLLIFFYFFLILSRIFLFQFITYIKKLKKISKDNIMIYGAGILGINLLNSLETKNVYCFIDDDPYKWGANLIDIKIFSPDFINQMITKYKISKIIVAIGGLSPNKKLNILNKINNNIVDIIFLDLDNKIINKNKNLITELISSKKNKINIPSDTIITNSVVLITGAGGSIGSEICLQVLYFKPKKIILFDNSEFNIFKLSSKINSLLKLYNIHNTEIVKYIDSIQDINVLKQIFETHRPSIIMHAAAFKHVSINQTNINSIFRNNVIGTYNVLLLAKEYKCSNFLLISTDKAVNPTNIMGATKRIAELLTLGFDKANNILKTTVVRFGNVMNSTGSVIPIFEQQIKEGGPITLTDHNVSRYFITIQDAVMLVLESLKISEGGSIYVLKMGKPIKIYDIAKKLINQNGYTLKNKNNPHGDIEIIITGLKSGEKKFEELFINNKSKLTSNPDILKSDESINYELLCKSIIDDISQKNKYNDSEIESIFNKYVENYE